MTSGANKNLLIFHTTESINYTKKYFGWLTNDKYLNVFVVSL